MALNMIEVEVLRRLAELLPDGATVPVSKERLLMLTNFAVGFAARGRKAAAARFAKQTPAERAEYARRAALARWRKEPHAQAGLRLNGA